MQIKNFFSYLISAMARGKKVLCGLFVGYLYTQRIVSQELCSQLPSAAANGNCLNRPKLGKSLRSNHMKNEEMAVS